MKHGLATLVGIGVVLGIGTAGHADRIHLRNGGTMEGVVVKQDASRVVMRVGSKMTVELRAAEIARIERDAPEVNAQTRSAWAAAETRGPQAAPAGEATGEPASDSLPADLDADADEPAPQTPDQVRVQAALERIDTIEGRATPEAVRADIGAPQSESAGETPLGQPYLDWTYDIGAGNVMVIRFVKTAGGYFATSRNLEKAPTDAADSAAESGAEQ